MLRIIVLGFLSFASIYLIDAQSQPQHDRKVVCYVASWTVYRAQYKFTPTEIDPSLCTHLIYLYVDLKNDTQDALISYSTYTDLNKDYGLGYYEKITALKKNHPNLKVLLCIGGWVQGSINLSKLAGSKLKRSSFVKSAVAYLREHNFDGLDIFWQYPAQRGGSPDDKDNFAQLLKELKEEFKKHNYLLTVVLTSTRSTIEKGYDLPSIGQTVDFVNLYGHGINSPWDKRFGVSSPLDSIEGNSVKKSINYFLNNGVPSSKLVLVLSTVGFGFKNADQLGSADGLAGLYDEDKGFLTYFEICQNLTDPKSGWKETWDHVTSTPIAVKGHDKISYDNEESIKLKVKYAYEKNLTGVGVWRLDTDDFLGLCSLPGYGNEDNRSKYPIVKAINQELERLYKKELENFIPKPNISVTVVIHEY